MSPSSDPRFINLICIFRQSLTEIHFGFLCGPRVRIKGSNAGVTRNGRFWLARFLSIPASTRVDTVVTVWRLRLVASMTVPIPPEKPLFCRGTEGSNLAPSTSESGANLTFYPEAICAPSHSCQFHKDARIALGRTEEVLGLWIEQTEGPRNLDANSVVRAGGYPDPRRAWPSSTRRDDLRLGVGRLGLWHWLLLRHVIRMNVPESCRTVAPGQQ
jgi:hypothetical protein